MGLDTVEIVMEIEDAFDIHIADEEAGKIVTVGDAVRVVIAKRYAGRPHGCVGSWTFRKLRRGLGEALGIPRDAVRRETPLAALIPERRRLDQWRRLEAAAGLTLPGLTLSRRYHTAIGVTACAAGAILGGIVAHGGGSVTVSIASAVAVATTIAPGLTRDLRSCANQFDPRITTIEGLTLAVRNLNFGALCDERQRWDEREVFAVVREITGKQLGLDPETITREDAFVNDLGAD